ncbi:hypothetical protein OLC90_10300, partial [Streptococcus pneumoniae]|nr:hypothetical protein [Streptococcus pneumoniae]
MVTDIEQARKNYMADYTPVDLTDAHKLLELAEKLQNEDISINTYELYKHPEAREKLFWQIAEATYMLLEPQLFTPNLKTIQNPCLSLDPGWFLF